MLYVVSRRAGGDTSEIKPPKRSDILKTWMLPAMAAAMNEDEDEAEAFKMLESVRNLNKAK